MRIFTAFYEDLVEMFPILIVISIGPLLMCPTKEVCCLACVIWCAGHWTPINNTKQKTLSRLDLCIGNGCVQHYTRNNKSVYIKLLILSSTGGYSNR